MTDTLLNFSGGVDSTYALWKYLKNNPDKTLLVHHCHYLTVTNRHNQETDAVEGILSWLDDQGLTNYDYLQTTVDIRMLGVRPLDNQVIAFMTGTILLNHKYRNLKYYLNCAPKDEEDRLKGILDRIRDDFTLIRDNVKLYMIGDPKKPALETVYALEGKYKKQIIEEMPKELFDLTWYCRRGGVEPCGKCHTCKQVQR